MKPLFSINDTLDCFGEIWTVTAVAKDGVTVCRRTQDSFGKTVDIDHKLWNPGQLAATMRKVVAS